jgi:hypothetical protein
LKTADVVRYKGDIYSKRKEKGDQDELNYASKHIQEEVHNYVLCSKKAEDNSSMRKELVETVYGNACDTRA